MYIAEQPQEPYATLRLTVRAADDNLPDPPNGPVTRPTTQNGRLLRHPVAVPSNQIRFVLSMQANCQGEATER